MDTWTDSVKSFPNGSSKAQKSVSNVNKEIISTRIENVNNYLKTVQKQITKDNVWNVRMILHLILKMDNVNLLLLNFHKTVLERINMENVWNVVMDTVLTRIRENVWNRRNYLHIQNVPRSTRTVYASNVNQVIKLIGIQENVFKLPDCHKIVLKWVMMDIVLNVNQDLNWNTAQINVNEKCLR